MPIRLYNTLTRSVEELRPLRPPAVTMYVCGPTVYDESHIGHVRSAYVFDVLRRYLEYREHPVQFVRNVTDVDDKIIEKAKVELGQAVGDLKATCVEVAERYLARYHEALAKLGISTPSKEPRATQHIGEMQAMIRALIERNLAYVAGGDVYFAVRKLPGYGALSHRSLDELIAGARVEPEESKRDPLDFALWKSAKPGEPAWDSPWGPGRPGWHIECSAMSTKHLGDTFDIHGGGIDLIFPHHENEIAQAHGADKPFAKLWMHHGLVTVNGEKMSKSLGNYLTLEQALKAFHLLRCNRQDHDSCPKYIDPLKVFFLGSHYRSPLDWTRSNIQASSRRWFRWGVPLKYIHKAREEWQERWQALVDRPIVRDPIKRIEQEFEQAMDDDLNTPQALACLDRLADVGNALQQRIQIMKDNNITVEQESAQISVDLCHIGHAFGRFASLLGLHELAEWSQEPFKPTTAQEEKLRARERARQRKDFAEADRIRNELDAEGVVIEDTPTGSVLQRKL